MSIDFYVYMLTTIPKRAGELSKTLSSLNMQEVDHVILNYPDNCSKTGEAYPEVPPELLKAFPKLIVNYCQKDYGSMTKLVPGVKFLKQHYPNKNIGIILCDDDMLYHENFAKDLKHYHKKFPNAAIGFSGHVIAQSPFYYWNLKLYDAKRLWLGSTHGVDILHGFEGILYQTQFLDYNELRATGNYPEYVTRVDDEWISHCVAKKKIKRKVVKRKYSKPAKDLELPDPLNKHCNTINVYYQAQVIRLMVEKGVFTKHLNNTMFDSMFHSIPYLISAGLLILIGHLL